MVYVIQSSAEEILAAAEELLAARWLDAAIQGFDEAQSKGADAARCAAGRWHAHMLCGNFAAAWAESEAIRAFNGDGPGTLWRGADIAGKRIVVRCLHGFGDVVQFLSYAPQLQALARSVGWEVPPELRRIAPSFRGVEHVLSWGQENSALPDWDVQVEIMELPCILQTRLADLPIAANYLRLSEELVNPVRACMGKSGAPRIGLVWAAGEWNPSRSIPVNLIAPLLESGGCEFWNLQGGSARQCARENMARLHDAEPCRNGILSLAAVISRLDLVITVDTLAAHLAGALGVRAWVMLQYAADWRWMTGRSDSPWYPSLRLFRQPSPGDWPSVIQAVRLELDDWLACGRGSQAA